MAATGAKISRVFKNEDGTDRKGSVALLDTAENLVDSLDNLSVCLKHIEEKYIEEGGNDQGHTVDKQSALFQKLKENLDAARDLTDTLKREKWRLSRRELSVELRMGELEDYKSHLKKDMTDMNETVDALSMRVIQLENALCEEQEIQETLQAEKTDLEERLKDSEKKREDAETQRDALMTEVKGLRLQRSDSMVQKMNQEMSSKIEVLQLENHKLKDMIREAESKVAPPPSSEGDNSVTSAGNTSSTLTQKQSHVVEEYV